MVCPNCKGEYREGFTICAYCEVELIEAMELPTEEPKKKEFVFAEPIFLYSTDEGMNADILIAALKDNEIPVILKRTGAGEYLKIYMNMNSFGLDIYVPAVMLEKAQDILNNVIIGNDLSVNEIDNESEDKAAYIETDEQFESEVNHIGRNKTIKIALLFGMPWLFGVVFWFLTR